MSCELVGLELDAYLRKELSKVHHETIEQHLAACSQCRTILSDFQFIGRLLPLWQPGPPRLLSAKRLLRWIKNKKYSETPYNH